MKKIQTIGKLALLALSSVIVSCSNDDAPPAPIVAPVPAPSGIITATIDGTAFTASVLGQISYTNGVLTIQGADATAKSIQIQLEASAIGTYNLYGDVFGNAAYNPGIAGLGKIYSSIGCNADLPQTAFTPNGTITITDLSETKIAGTFQFRCAELQSCSDQKVITNGTFLKNL